MDDIPSNLNKSLSTLLFYHTADKMSRGFVAFSIADAFPDSGKKAQSEISGRICLLHLIKRI
ncbi:MAG: hypothetical protein AMJ92_00845 [candidate division Zixibacteria bacterium SM23_81]|nr:MAG: hypothetical protein AMJ92_00845 [candidate division Zixibacteria bacterium SM23_81]